MNIFKKRSKWSRATQPLRKTTSGGALRAGLGTMGGIVGATVASAVVSALRDRRGE